MAAKIYLVPLDMKFEEKPCVLFTQNSEKYFLTKLKFSLKLKSPKYSDIPQKSR